MLFRSHGWTVDAELRRWHPAAEDWEDPDKPLPEGNVAQMAEHEALMAAEGAYFKLYEAQARNAAAQDTKGSAP